MTVSDLVLDFLRKQTEPMSRADIRRALGLTIDELAGGMKRPLMSGAIVGVGEIGQRRYLAPASPDAGTRLAYLDRQNAMDRARRASRRADKIARGTYVARGKYLRTRTPKATAMAPQEPAGGAETVEQFIARGGVVDRLEAGDRRVC